MSPGTIIATGPPRVGPRSHDPVDAHDLGNDAISVHDRPRSDTQRCHRPQSPLQVSSTHRDRHRQAVRPSRAPSAPALGPAILLTVLTLVASASAAQAATPETMAGTPAPASTVRAVLDQARALSARIDALLDRRVQRVAPTPPTARAPTEMTPTPGDAAALSLLARPGASTPQGQRVLETLTLWQARAAQALETQTSAGVAPGSAAPPEIITPPTVDAPAVPPRMGTAPLPDPTVPDLPKRVLSLPGAALAATPGGTPDAYGTLPTFTVLFVFERRVVDGQAWVAVGRSLVAGAEGWLPVRQTETWRSMLVMQFTPPGDRQPVLFFKDKATLEDLAASPFMAEEASALYADIRAGRPARDRLAAVEPPTSVAFQDTPYLLPILDWEFTLYQSTLSDGTLLRVAGLNSETTAETANANGRPLPNLSLPDESRLRDMKTGIVFVMDTTLSMGPYIEQAYQTVDVILDELERAGLTDKLAFGLVGYRDNTAPNPAIDYVTRTFLPLDAANTPEMVRERMRSMAPSQVSTQDWREDAFAALGETIASMDWEAYDARFILLITDAGARSGVDPLARYPNLETTNLVSRARDHNIAIVPIHLITRAGHDHDDVDSARRQYLSLAATGSLSNQKYMGLPADSIEIFEAQLGRMSQELADMLTRQQRGEASPGRAMAPPMASDLGDIFMTEMRRAELQYLGVEEGVAPPRFYRAWVAQEDLVDAERAALEVRVFLTRTQLSALSRALQVILEAALHDETDSTTFFENLQLLAAGTAVTGRGGRHLARTTHRSAAAILPAFLQVLPYRSDVLRLDETFWRNLGEQGQRDFIDRLQSKLREYARIEGDSGWINLAPGAGRPEPELEVYPLALDLLP